MIPFRKAVDWIKDYGLPTLSIVGPVVYMVVFHVTPWDTYFEIRDKREQVRFHNHMGEAMLKSGSYAKAKEEYERAVALSPTSYEGLNGQYLAELFMGFDSLTWDPATGMNVRKHLDDLGIVRRAGYREIVLKYLGDLDQRIGSFSRAQALYDSAIALDPGYLDALFSDGWLSYGSGANLKKMTDCFRRMALLDSFDYRGFHGYGYALYMRALDSASRKADPGLIRTAAEQSVRARNLGINKLNVLMDFGEIARSINPAVSLVFHRAAEELIADPARSALRENAAPLQSCLLAVGSDCVGLENAQQKRAWIGYQIALDYEALRRLGPDATGEHRDSGDAVLKRARALDGNAHVLPIYLDQRKILALFLPERTAEAP